MKYILQVLALKTIVWTGWLQHSDLEWCSRVDGEDSVTAVTSAYKPLHRTDTDLQQRSLCRQRYQV